MLREPTANFTVRSYTGTANPRDPLLSPLFADLRGLPPTLLMVGSQEVLLSDVTRMGDRFEGAGVPVKVEVWPGMPHSFNSSVRENMETRLSVQHIADFISARFA